MPAASLLHPCCTCAVSAGVLDRAHTVAAMDQTKLQEASSSRLHSVGGSGDAIAADQGDSSAWRKQRPGATFFEKLQVSYGHFVWLLLQSCFRFGGQMNGLVTPVLAHQS